MGYQVEKTGGADIEWILAVAERAGWDSISSVTRRKKN